MTGEHEDRGLPNFKYLEHNARDPSGYIRRLLVPSYECLPLSETLALCFGAN